SRGPISPRDLLTAAPMREERRQNHDAPSCDLLVGPVPELPIVARHQRVDEHGYVESYIQNRSHALIPVVGAVGTGTRPPRRVRRRPAPEAGGNLVHLRTLTRGQRP